MSAPVRDVVIVGRDAAAWLTALGLQRALGRTGLRIHVVELPSLLGAVDAYSAVPSLGGLHRHLGIAEDMLLGRCAAVPVLGQRFAGWSGSGSEFLHGYDKIRPSINDVDLFQFWVKGRAEGLRIAWDDFSLAASAAKQGRMAPRDGDPESLSNISPGYHLHAPAYVDLVQQLALRSGVERRREEAVSVERQGEHIAAILLDGGEEIRGDFYIDASGPEAVLLGGQPDAEFESWAAWLPCDRLVAASGPAFGTLPAFSQVTAFRSGWVGLFPLQDRTAIVAAWDSSEMADAEVLQEVGIVTGRALEGERIFRTTRARAQLRPWIGNCVAIGEAAIGLEPLDGVQLHLTHVGLSHLIALFPVDAETLPEAESYNAAIRSHARNIRDFQIAHYRLNERSAEPFWDRARKATGPDSLDGKLALFASRGQVAEYDDESFEGQNWASIFVGHGLMPQAFDPMVNTVPREEQIEKFQRLLRHIATEVEAMETVNAYIGSAAASAAARASRGE